jgi:hypothetical protein
MAKLVPLLQIIHGTDLHLCDNYSDRVQLGSDEKSWLLRFRDMVEKRNLFGWHEGTLQHDESCEEPFERFLTALKKGAPEWFGDPDKRSSPQTWLIDTGDLTAFGDVASMRAAHHKLARWQSILGCRALFLFGNHDAWPGAQPAFMRPDWSKTIEIQRSAIGEFDPWRSDRWLAPLEVSVSSIGVRIELYGLDSVSYRFGEGVTALGRINEDAIEQLVANIRAEHASHRQPTYRILATHHPVVFPFCPSDVRKFCLVPAMRLVNAEQVIRILRNETSEGITSGLMPLVHLFLSGHTHLGYPGDRLPFNVKAGRKGGLGVKQLQLVSGPWMLTHDGAGLREDVAALPRKLSGFGNVSVFAADSQFQVLRFYANRQYKDRLTLDRRVFVRLSNDGPYHCYEPLTSRSIALI